MARMRYAAQALELIRELDPNTSISLNYIRALAKNKKIPVHQVGKNRRLINVDALLEFLSHPENGPIEENQTGIIRRVSERGERYGLSAATKK